MDINQIPFLIQHAPEIFANVIKMIQDIPATANAAIGSTGWM